MIIELEPRYHSHGSTQEPLQIMLISPGREHRSLSPIAQWSKEGYIQSNNKC
jgi:hypothetical protein